MKRGLKEMDIIDLSLVIDNECMTCGTEWHEKICIKSLGRIEQVGRNTHSILLGSHTGTHIDAPLHFFDNESGIDQLDLHQVCGDVVVIDFTYIRQGQYVRLEDVQKIKVGKRMLFRFDWFKKWKTEEYYKQFPYFTMESVQYLVEKGMQLIALDTPSPDDSSGITSKNDSLIHKYLLSNNVTILEYLTDTDKLKKDKQYQLFALPIKIRNCDGAPARVIAVQKNSIN